MEKLQQQVTDAIRAAQFAQEMQSSITMSEYKDWGNYDKHLKLNIQGMYNQASLHRRGN